MSSSTLISSGGSLLSSKAVALYVHWPFCLAKCPYCDFNSHVATTIPQQEYGQALLHELHHALTEVKGRTLTSIFFGGGTPSLMDANNVQNLIDAATGCLPTAPDLEITLEANPTSVEIQKLNDFKLAGVNRVSLGIQSLDPQALKALGRQHSVSQAIEALTLAKTLFDRVSFDLIYAREGQTLSQWQRELKQALDLTHDHLSLYQLTIEPGTLFAKYDQQGKLHLPNDRLSNELYLATEALVQPYGMENYEISNYARKGSESRHNLAYWRYQDYIGIGPGAHGRVSIDQTLYATERHRNPQKWLNAVKTHGHALSIKEALSQMDMAREMLLMGLRLTEGVNATAFQNRCNFPLIDALNMDMLDALIQEGFLSWDQETLKTTHDGRSRLNAVLDAILK